MLPARRSTRQRWHPSINTRPHQNGSKAASSAWFHWGAHTTPQFYSEWYPHFIYDKSNGGGVYQHHLSTYGDPFADWPYEKFITGGTDKSGKFVQFAPKLVSAGGNWDPDAWAQWARIAHGARAAT